MKPSYNCANCMYPSAGTSSTEAFGEPCETLRASPPCRSSAVCTQPSFLLHGAPEFMGQAFCEPPSKMTHGAKVNSLPSVLARSHEQEIEETKLVGAWECESSEKAKDVPKMPPRVLLGQRNSFCERSPVLSEGPKEDTLPRKDAKQTKDLKYLLFSKELEKPTPSSYLMQHQESLLQLQKAGLVRKHTKELERLKSLPSELVAQTRETPSGPTNTAAIPEETQDSMMAHLGRLPLLGLSPAISEDAENDPVRLQKTPVVAEEAQKTSTPVLGGTDHVSSFTKDFLKTICYTPSSSRSSNLTRSSSSDSIHSVRGKPGLVKQRTQEIETRLRLAGLTVSSPLKRSNSLAKLGSLNLSSEDLTSDTELSTLAYSRETKSSESSAGRSIHPLLPSTEEASKLLIKPAMVKLKGTLWMDKS